MPSIFSKNCIISNELDYYCLVCKKHYKYEEEAIGHILDSSHKEQLAACGYFEQYRDEYIRKVNDLYFCEVCNTSISISHKVKLHVKDPYHIVKKTEMNGAIKRSNNGIIHLNNIISEEAWNGLDGKSCVLCNKEFDDKKDEEEHKNSQSHIIKLVNSKLLDHIYCLCRKVEDKLYHCLSCNKLFSEDIDDHMRSEAHKKSLKPYVPQSEAPPSVEDQPIKTDNVKTENKYVKVKTDIKDTETQNNTKPIKKTPKQALHKKRMTKEEDEAVLKKLKAKDYIIKKQNNLDWCVICEWSLDVPPEEHIRQKHHQVLLNLHKSRFEDEPNNNKGKNKEIKYENVDKYQKNNIAIDFLNEYAFCKKCSKNVDFNSDAIEAHIEEHKKNTNKKSNNTFDFSAGGKSNGADKTSLFTKPVFMNGNKDNKKKVDSVNVQDFAKEHGLSFNRADNSFYCKVCTRRLPTELNDLKKHVDTKGHKEKTAKQNNKQIMKPVVKTKICDFVKSFDFLETVDEVILIVNKKYWINAYGFCLLGKFANRVVCHACNIDFLPEYVFHHIMSSEFHKEVVGKCPIITSIEDEFIREIKLDVYHCGFCNHVENDWEDMLEHLATEEHAKEKAEAARNLRNPNRNITQFVSMEMDSIFKSFGFNRAT